MDIKKYTRIKKITGSGIKYVPPNFIFRDSLNKNSNVIDVGCGYEADFSVYMMKEYGAKCYAVDPTRKHQQFLKKIEQESGNRFVHIFKALGAKDGEMIFNESKEHESGSFYTNHINIKRDHVLSYKVKVISIPTLIKELNLTSVEILKIDIEGAEYELISQLKKTDLIKVKQLFIEFHHRQLDGFTKKDTAKAIDSINQFGFSSYSLDDINYLFVNNKSVDF